MTMKWRISGPEAENIAGKVTETIKYQSSCWFISPMNNYWANLYCSKVALDPCWCALGWQGTTVEVNQPETSCTCPALWHSWEKKFTVAFLPLLDVLWEATESSTTLAMMDHQRDLGHCCCTSWSFTLPQALYVQYSFAVSWNIKNPLCRYRGYLWVT